MRYSPNLVGTKVTTDYAIRCPDLFSVSAGTEGTIMALCAPRRVQVAIHDCNGLVVCPWVDADHLTAAHC